MKRSRKTSASRRTGKDVPQFAPNFTVYVLPPALVLLGLATLAIVLPRWRRRTRAARAQATAAQPPPPPATADAQRLDEELSHFAG